jgi:nicotinamide-nucleotide amidase
MSEHNSQEAADTPANEKLIKQAEKKAACLIKKLKAVSQKLALAESCTCGLISSLLAEVPGASLVLWGSFVCYTKEAKVSMLGLKKSELSANGLVSEKTARSMVEGVFKKSTADIAAAVTGLAGPDGDGSGVPVGTVWVSAALRDGEIKTKVYHFKGSRNEVRLRAACAVLEEIQKLLN